MRFALLFVLLLISACAPDTGGSQGGNDFAPAVICQDTGGMWEKVDATQVPVNEVQGVFDPDNHPDYNYRCTCPGGFIWSPNGCR